MNTYFYQKLRADTNNNLDLIKWVQAPGNLPGGVWGVFAGLFGPASNELLVVSHGVGEDVAAVASAVHSETWRPTARPMDAKPCDKEGLYVFRRFHVMQDDVQEVVALSKQAWETFEVSDDYAAEPQGLFVPESDEHGVVRMMLVTWYDGFTSWQRSRTPNPAAKDNFNRRHALTLTTYAVATRLVT